MQSTKQQHRPLRHIPGMQPPPRTTTWDSNTTSKISSAKSQNHSAKILKLPAELRNEIYRLVLVQNEPIDMVHAKFMFQSKRLDGPAEPGLLAVCTQIRTEATSIWYEENTFSYEETPGTFGKFDLTRLSRWLKRLGPKRTAKLKQLVLTYRASYGNKPYDDLRAWKGAEAFVHGLMKAGVKLGVVKIEGPRYGVGFYQRGDWRPTWRHAMEVALRDASIGEDELLSELMAGLVLGD